MTLSDLLARYSKLPILKTALREFEKGVHTIELNGLNGSSRMIILGALAQQSKKAMVCIANDSEEAGYHYNDLVQLLGDEQVLFFPSSYKRAVKYGQIDPAMSILRTEVLSRIAQSGKDNYVVVVSYPDALVEKVVTAEELTDKTLSLSVGEKVDSTFVADVLFEYGFERVDYVYEPGQYAVRGSILDVFSFSHDWPYRIDFFGPEIESIRTFDIENQLSREKKERISIIPNLNTSSSGSKGESFMRFLPDNTIWAFDDFEWSVERAEQVVADGLSEHAVESYEYDAELTSKLIAPNEYKTLLNRFRRITFGNKSTDTPLLPQFSSSKGELFFVTAAQPLFHKNFDLIASALRNYSLNGYDLFILSDSEKQTTRLQTIFDERNDRVRFTPILKTLHEGFVDHELKCVLFTDHQIFDRFHKYNLKSDKARTGKLTLSLKELQQFEIGDFIVHLDHGVGKFGGLVRGPINGRMQEMVKLTFQNDDQLFVSIHSLHKLSKYRGKEGEPPRVNKLGTGAWERMKERTKAKVKDIARDLILLYAKRREEKGFSYSPDSFMQEELEASFLYEDTPDQLKTTVEVKRDMEGERPMDRLVCGDVGFGKTEIAVRAAFKAVADNKQVAVLVPTTVLAYQHYKTFSERLKSFPCRVEYLSRARKGRDAKEIIEDINEGKIGIIVGTHRIVSKDIRFKDLGLLIIDEEQKFGVSVKEKLRQMRANVDTLTMTATPIPRTLQFSLMGARDLSVIQTPPPNRHPILTEVHTPNDEILTEAINFELSRNGQVFIINNRISSIYDIESTIRRLVPNARMAVGHGQMDPEKLEEIIIDFSNHEFDILIATTIIENGIDIPNANTIIIYNAQNFGLSELHQLRGRVGRSNKKAFCYLLAPPLHSLTVEARRRLQAIENFADLGSGIHIAMQDLDIRGAGNMLGAEQSGFIADLGYEAYQKILQEAVTELRNEEFADLYNEIEKEEASQTNASENGVVSSYSWVNDCVVESDLELLFPADYIPNDSERIGLYRELDEMDRESDITAFVGRLKDRFGKIPYEGQELIRIVRLRRLSKQLGFERAVLKNNKMILHFIGNTKSAFYESDTFGQIIQYAATHARRCHLTEKNGKRSMTFSNIPNVETAVDILQQMLAG